MNPEELSLQQLMTPENTMNFLMEFEDLLNEFPVLDQLLKELGMLSLKQPR